MNYGYENPKKIISHVIVPIDIDISHQSHRNNNNKNWILNNEARSINVEKNKKEDLILFQREDDLFESLKIFLIFGQIIGLIPLQIIGKKSVQNLYFRKFSISYIICWLIWVSLGANVIVTFVGFIQTDGQNPRELAFAFGTPMFYFTGFYFNGYFLFYTEKFVRLLKSWTRITAETTLEIDKKLSKSANLMAGIIFTSCILENAAFHIRLIPALDMENANKTFLETFYVKTHSQWADNIPYHPAISLLLFFTNKFALYSWNYADLIIAILARGLAHKLQSLQESKNWLLFNHEYILLLELYEIIEDFVSPMIFWSYTINIFAFCLQLNLGLTPSQNISLVHTLYSSWSFIHLIARLLIVSLCAAKVHEQATIIHEMLQRCPKEYFSNEVKRLEKIASNPIAFTGLKCFNLTRSFILTSLNVVFSIEIVLLQSVSVSNPPHK